MNITDKAELTITMKRLAEQNLLLVDLEAEIERKKQAIDREYEQRLVKQRATVEALKEAVEKGGQVLVEEIGGKLQVESGGVLSIRRTQETKTASYSLSRALSQIQYHQELLDLGLGDAETLGLYKSVVIRQPKLVSKAQLRKLPAHVLHALGIQLVEKVNATWKPTKIQVDGGQFNTEESDGNA